MIKIALGELRDVTEGLTELVSKDLPVKTAYWFGKLTRIIRKEIVELEEARNQLIQKHGMRDEKNKIIVKDDKYQISDLTAFNAEFQELLGTEIAIDFKPIAISQLGDVKISSLAMAALEKFVEFDEA